LIIATLILVVYLIGYTGSRMSNLIVHSVVRDHSNKYLEHSVVSGDGKFLGGIVMSLTSIVFTPCRYFELDIGIGSNQQEHLYLRSIVRRYETS